MSVKNSAQVFSRTVYAGLQNLLEERSPDLHGLPPTASEHSFIADMKLIKNRLTRPNTNFTKRYTALMDTTLRLLPLHGHKRGIMKLIKRYINTNHNIPSFSCEIHDVTNALVNFTIKFTNHF
ncbi:hypothetical protein CBL_20599 [Carabus blaptoides fortunei]